MKLPTILNIICLSCLGINYSQFNPYLVKRNGRRGEEWKGERKEKISEKKRISFSIILLDNEFIFFSHLFLSSPLIFFLQTRHANPSSYCCHKFKVSMGSIKSSLRMIGSIETWHKDIKSPSPIGLWPKESHISPILKPHKPLFHPEKYLYYSPATLFNHTKFCCM